ncbi:MAG: hypothetical protein JO069_03540 [Verrucomicrobia bacterium]|nr:hypothetical protein [Verrucomicrobiota bacterium]
MKKLWIIGMAIGLGLTGFTAQASVVTLNWNTVPQGPLTKSGSSYTDVVKLDGGEVEVTVAPSGPVALSKFGTPAVQTPAVTDAIFQGGQPAGSSNLSSVAHFLPPKGKENPTITYTIDFLGFKGVSDVRFDLFDVDSTDRAKFVDQITFQTAGVSLTAGKDNVVTGGNTVTGRAASPNLGPGSDAGNVGVSYGSLPSDKIVFTYTNPLGNASVNGFGIGNVSFTPVPEVNQLAIGLAACALAVVWLRQRNRRTAADLT